MEHNYYLCVETKITTRAFRKQKKISLCDTRACIEIAEILQKRARRKHKGLTVSFVKFLYEFCD